MSCEPKCVTPENLTNFHLLAEDGPEKLKALIEWCREHNTKVLLYTVFTYCNNGEPLYPTGELEEHDLFRVREDYVDDEWSVEDEEDALVKEFVEEFPQGGCDDDSDLMRDKPWDRGEVAKTIRDDLSDWLELPTTWNAWKAQKMFTEAYNRHFCDTDCNAFEIFEGVTQVTLEVSGKGIYVKEVESLSVCEDLELSEEDDDDSLREYYRYFCQRYYDDPHDFYHVYY